MYLREGSYIFITELQLNSLTAITITTQGGVLLLTISFISLDRTISRYASTKYLLQYIFLEQLDSIFISTSTESFHRNFSQDTGTNLCISPRNLTDTAVFVFSHILLSFNLFLNWSYFNNEVFLDLNHTN